MTTASTRRCAGHSNKGAIFTRIDQTQPTRPQALSAGCVWNTLWQPEETAVFLAPHATPHHPRPLSGMTPLSIHKRKSHSARDKDRVGKLTLEAETRSDKRKKRSLRQPSRLGLPNQFRAKTTLVFS
jgi:hypothetical protein